MDKKYFIFIGVVLLLMLVHIEFVLDQTYAPETVLIGVETPSGNPEENAECFADIISLDINLENKPLQNLESIYDFVDSSTYFASQDKGFYLLETGFENYQGEFEVKIVCYSPGFSGVSYTIVTDKDNTCEIKEDGKFLVC